MSTFTWPKDGIDYQVEIAYDVDTWTGRELRVAERLAGGSLADMGRMTMATLAISIGVARTVPGYTIEQADAELTVGRVQALTSEASAKVRARREAEAAAAEVAPLEGSVVESPTKPDSGADAQEAPQP